MNKLKLNYTSLSFLPILVCIPLGYQLITNLHFGGFKLFQEFFISAFNPKIDNEIIFTVINRLNETILIAFFSWLVSIIFGAIFGILSSNIFYKIFNIPNLFYSIIRFFLTIIRSLHEVVWGLLLMQIYGINFSIGIIAICIPYIAVNSKVFAEQLETIDYKIFESINQINAPKFSFLLTLIWNPIINTFKNFGLYRLECSIRSTLILGLFGIGGIGTSILLSLQTLNFRELWTYLWSLAILIIISSLIFKKIKFNNTNKNLSIIFIVVIFITILLSFSYFLYFVFNNNFENFNSISFLFKSSSDLELFNFLKLILETIILSLLSTGIAISLPPLLIGLFNNNTSKILIKFFAFLLRLIPTPVILITLLTFNNPSLSLAALTLGLHNAGITSKLLFTNLDSQDKSNYIAMKSLGISKKTSWLLGLFSQQAKSYLAYCAYRSDIIIRETAIVGIIGSVGLGWQLQESLSSFAGKEVIMVLTAYSSIAIVGELINGKIKNSLT
ncbi:MULTISPECIES: PhnE/PtxC family ABC transporter permease [Prochlorococcus]|uniref:Phosphonate ABC transporter permease protein phnE n=1 Tax=Prochlorococcus marinus str. MIT 9116 TaxID=167544 RepID=A0A0A1ZSD0_PROMR|nr:phosphonate ABC transporter [Prochlorococcus marinus]KGF89801.1 Phosphonate ABC transporter permease protein phnE [Prochlorococcus marinus str. MIT 9107]KGF92350.1 Phosphonate ABC transporter permease protein phnE [Prochlorococcus marinus str. MIT 9116]